MLPCIHRCTFSKHDEYDYLQYPTNNPHQECFNTCFKKHDSNLNILVVLYGKKYSSTEYLDILQQKEMCVIIPDDIRILISNKYMKFNLKTTLNVDNVYDGVENLDVSNFIDKKIIAIPSIIHIKYNSERSIFESHERFKQTICQVESIKKYIPDVKIVLLEMSQLTSRELFLISPFVDAICLFENDSILFDYAHRDSNKNKAEVYVLKCLLKKIIDNGISPTHFSKFGGRYWFSHSVNHGILFQNMPVMKKEYAECYQQHIIEPVFYSIPFCESVTVLELYENMLNEMEHNFTDNERLLYEMYAKNKNICYPEHMHIQGYMATTGLFRFF